MSKNEDPTDAVQLPSPFDRALERLIARAAAAPSDEAAALKAALFGGTAPTFGQVRKVSPTDLKSAAGRACPTTPVVLVNELAGLLPRVDPQTPVCGACGEFPLSSAGGKVFSLPVGAACPFCPKGRLELVPMKLRMLAWTDGRLVEPDTTHDLRVRPGWELPLQDAGIRGWADEWIESRLERALRDAGTPLYAFLAYMRLGRKALKRLEDVPELLHDPNAFGLTDARAIAQAAKSARAFAEGREVTNVPAKPLLIERLGGRDLPRLAVAGRTYRLEGRIGQGDTSDVFRAFWDHEPTERVVLKICRALEDADLMKKEARVLKAIQASDDPGAYFFTRVLPEIIAEGTASGPDGIVRPVTVLRDKNRFDWTLEDVIREYPDGVEPQTMVWMWNRVLTLLAWTHRIGYVHGAILPSHVLLDVESHQATLLDWSAAVRCKGGKERIEVVSDGYEAYYPTEALSGGKATPATDIAMSARCMIAVLGGNPETGESPATVPDPIADFLKAHARCGVLLDGRFRIYDDAEALEKAFAAIVEKAYGKRRFHPFAMPRT